MAEILNHSTGKRKFKIRSTRVDLTPMVDLGFLLITFFVFTTSLSEQKSIGMMMPNDTNKSIFDDVPLSKVITLTLKAGNVIEYFEGNEVSLVRQTDYNSSGIRTVLLNKREKVLRTTGKDETIVIIRPTDSSNFNNLVSIMDEMMICGVKKYYID
jgi:biopolymer transport protein ExbD